MIEFEEINIKNIEEFWKLHIAYLVDDEIISDLENIEYFKSDEYRNVIKEHMIRKEDKHHLIYFLNDCKRIGAASYCTYKFEEIIKQDGATYYAINSAKEDYIRF